MKILLHGLVVFLLASAFSDPECAAADAVFSPNIGTPACAAFSDFCDSAALLTSRGAVAPGEPNQPNTLEGCPDGNNGVYQSDESIDAIRVSTTDGANLAEGSAVTVDVTVWVFNPAVDFLDLYYLTNTNPTWIPIATGLAPTNAGAFTYSVPFTLGAGGVQLIRANFRFRGAASPCSAGPFDDTDDLVFVVEAASAACSGDPDCDDADLCTVDTCSNPGQAVAVCNNDPIACGTADGCCSPGCSAGTDPDCTADLSFVVYGDVQGNDSQHARVMDAVDAQDDIAFTICAGDMAPLDNEEEATENSWDVFLSFATQIAAPFWPVRGNHDGDGSQAGTFPAYRNVFSFVNQRAEYASGEVLYYSFDYADSHFIVLEVIEGGLVADQATWLAADLASDEAQQAQSLFVFTHYPIVGPGPQQEAGRWDTYIAPFFDAASLAKLTLFAGHEHTFWKGEFQGVDVVVGPSVADPLPRWRNRTLGPGELYQEVSGFLRIDCTGSQVDATAFDLDGVQLFSFPLK